MQVDQWSSDTVVSGYPFIRALSAEARRSNANAIFISAYQDVRLNGSSTTQTNSKKITSWIGILRVFVPENYKLERSLPIVLRLSWLFDVSP